VLRDHIDRSSAGFHYRTTEELAEVMEQALALDADERARMGDRGRRYVLDRYSEESIRARLVDAVERAANGMRLGA
jgi:glycosyltransferase involved in cell wall biosynthesis